MSGRASPALDLQRWRNSSRDFLLLEKCATLVAVLCDCCLLPVACNSLAPHWSLLTLCHSFAPHCLPQCLITMIMMTHQRWKSLIWMALRMKVSEFPNIWRLARKYLALPATAAPSERAFSIAGLIISAKQASLDPSTVTDLHFLRENWEHVFSP